MLSLALFVQVGCYEDYEVELEARTVSELHQALLERGYEIPRDEFTAVAVGPGTTAAVRAFQTTAGLTVDGIAGPKTWAALADNTLGRRLAAGWRLDLEGAQAETAAKALTIAAGEIGVQEHPSRSNRGPRVDVYLTAGQTDARCYLEATGRPCVHCAAHSEPQPGCRGAPWCALFARWCYTQAGVDLPQRGLQLASALRWLEWGEQHGRIVKAPRPGDLWLVVRGDANKSGHCGIVAALVGTEKMATIEGNAGPGAAHVAGLVRPLSTATAFIRVIG